MIRYRFPLFSGLTNSQNETIGLDSKYSFSPNLILLIVQKEAALGLLHKNAAPAIDPVFVAALSVCMEVTFLHNDYVPSDSCS
jgi:hypothetical protein